MSVAFTALSRLTICFMWGKKTVDYVLNIDPIDTGAMWLLISWFCRTVCLLPSFLNVCPSNRIQTGGLRLSSDWGRGPGLGSKASVTWGWKCTDSMKKFPETECPAVTGDSGETAFPYQAWLNWPGSSEQTPTLTLGIMLVISLSQAYSGYLLLLLAIILSFYPGRLSIYVDTWPEVMRSWQPTIGPSLQTLLPELKLCQPML